MIMFAHELLSGTYADISMRRLLDIYALVESRLAGLSVVNGVLRAGTVGLHPTMNPSERRNGAVRYRSLAREHRRWAVVAARLQQYLQMDLCSVSHMLSIVRRARLRSYPGACNYGNVRLVRSITEAANATAMGSAACWSTLAGMSPHVRSVVRRWAIDHHSALRLCTLMRRELSLPQYTLQDLVCFPCLADLD